MNIPSYGPDDKRKKIALVQTGSWGDNINSTLMFKPLKAKYPDCVLDVYTSSYYKSAFVNNPYINHLAVHQSSAKNESLHLTLLIPDMIKNVGYDLILKPHPMFNQDKWTSTIHGELGTNLILAWVRALEDNKIEYTLPLETVLLLSDAEVERARQSFISAPTRNRNILMEVHGESGQTHWNPEWTVKVGKHLLNSDCNLFISRNHDGHDINELRSHAPSKVHFVGGLSIRECAELYNHCQVFMSVSSGLSNACNTNWCKKDIMWFETVNGPGANSAPIRSTGKTFYYENDIDKLIGILRDAGL